MSSTDGNEPDGNGPDGNEPGLRVGGWIPPYEREVFPRPQHPDQHVVIPISVHSRVGHRIAAVSPARRRVVVLSGAVVTAAAIAGITLAYQVGQPDPSASVAARLPVLGGPAVPFVPVPFGSAPTTSPAGWNPPPIDIPERQLGLPVSPRTSSSSLPTSKSPSPGKTSKSPSPSPGVTSAPPFVTGAVIGLEPLSQPGYRVRHRDFRGRLDRLGSQSSAGDRADSRFVVRVGLADANCLTFESVNYPGYYLRHQNFVLRLQRNDRSQLFAADATFCSVPGQSGVMLRSVNYPSYFWAERDDELIISPRGAVTFAVRPAL